MRIWLPGVSQKSRVYELTLTPTSCVRYSAGLQKRAQTRLRNDARRRHSSTLFIPPSQQLRHFRAVEQSAELERLEKYRCSATAFPFASKPAKDDGRRGPRSKEGSGVVDWAWSAGEWRPTHSASCQTSPIYKAWTVPDATPAPRTCIRWSSNGWRPRALLVIGAHYAGQ